MKEPWFSVNCQRKLLIQTLTGGESGALILGGGHPGEMLEIFSERRLIGEVEFVGNLLDVFARETQKVFSLENNELVDPLGRSPPGYFLDNERKIFRRNEKFVGIKGNRALFGMVAVNERHEFLFISEAPRTGAG